VTSWVTFFAASSNKGLNAVQERIDIRTVSNKLHVQGVTQLLLHCLDGDDYECVSDAMTSLAAMSFQVIKGDIMKENILQKICQYAMLRNDCFFAGLQLTSHAIIFGDYFLRFVDIIITEYNAITILVKAMKLSGWVFHLKSNVYEALSLLAGYAGFRERVRKCRGINVVVYELDVRKKYRLFQRKNHMELEEDHATERLYAVLKEDWAAIRIQATCRSHLIRKRGERPDRSNDSQAQKSIFDDIMHDDEDEDEDNY